MSRSGCRSSLWRKSDARLRERDISDQIAAKTSRVGGKLYGIDDLIGSNTIPVHVHHLRRKMLEAGATVEIHTIRGVGYLLDERKT